MKIHEKIKIILKSTRGLSQKGLAEHLRINPAAVCRMLQGNRKILAEELPAIEVYIGKSLEGDTETEVLSQPRQQDKIPVYTTQKNIRLLHDREPVDWIDRHPGQFRIRGAFALYVFSDEMAPRYYPGELLYIHPSRPLERGRDCLLEMKDGSLLVGRFMRDTKFQIIISSFNHLRQKTILKKHIHASYVVIGRG